MYHAQARHHYRALLRSPPTDGHPPPPESVHSHTAQAPRSGLPPRAVPVMQ